VIVKRVDAQDSRQDGHHELLRIAAGD